MKTMDINRIQVQGSTDTAELSALPQILPMKPSIQQKIEHAWSKIAPFWPLKNLIAVNPISGFEDQFFEDALDHAQEYFLRKDLPVQIQRINLETIKWLQAFFDEGQSTLSMPLRNLGLLNCIRTLMAFDSPLFNQDKKKMDWFKRLPTDPQDIIIACYEYLDIQTEQQTQFLTLLLTTLPGWAAYIQYKAHWAELSPKSIMHSEYLAFRLILTCLLWPQAKDLLNWHQNTIACEEPNHWHHQICKNEADYLKPLLTQLNQQDQCLRQTNSKAQFVFCIDVRSEPFRRAIEAQSGYETFGFAGFFGLPISIHDPATKEHYASCPVLIQPKHKIHISENPKCHHAIHDQSKQLSIKKLYQSLKYNFVTPFVLADFVGIGAGIAMLLKTLTPKYYDGLTRLKLRVNNLRLNGGKKHINYSIEAISLDQQVTYAHNALRMMGMTRHFSPFVILCGHGSTTQNNAFATALDCGACGGRAGDANARIMADILNNPAVRTALKQHHIDIPMDTQFIGALHNTTTDEVILFDDHLPDRLKASLEVIKQDLQAAQVTNHLTRQKRLTKQNNYRNKPTVESIGQRAADWAQIRPEWGLARNAAFIIAPRSRTAHIDLEGRAFLHSYTWEDDPEGKILESILTAPVIVAQWINAQYLFSTLDNTAFGAGSKVTLNITGKMGVMQGNASDLMHGLPLQSVYESDHVPYHQPMRLSVIVNAPRKKLSTIILKHSILKKLFGNDWILLICHDPETNQQYRLKGNMQWTTQHDM